MLLGHDLSMEVGNNIFFIFAFIVQKHLEYFLVQYTEN